MILKICRERLKKIETASVTRIIIIQDTKERCVRRNSVHLCNTRLNTTVWMSLHRYPHFPVLLPHALPRPEGR